MCVCVYRMYSKLTSVINLYHIQLTPCSKLVITTLRLPLLAGIKQGGASKLRLSIITGFNCCVTIVSYCLKNAPTFSHCGNIKNAKLLWCYVVPLCDYFQKFRRHDDLSNRRKPLIQKRKTER